MGLAVLIMAVAMTLVPLGDTAGKLLIATHGLPTLLVAWLRFVVGAAAVLPLAARHGTHWRAVLDWRVYLRGALITAAILAILTALKTEDIGSVFGAFFIGPILSYVLSVLLLGERVSAGRTALLLTGFLGVLLVVRPGFGMTPGLGFAVLAGVFYGGYLTASRWVADVAPAPMLLAVQMLFGATVLAPFAAPLWPAGALPWGLLAISGLASLAGNLLLVVAYARAPATRLAPFIYFQLVAATAFGVLVFGTWPDALALAGLGLLLLSGFASLALPRGA